jgi:uncharacterized protein (TIGR02453 family)
MADFEGFSRAGLTLLGRLPEFEKDEFEAHRKEYRAELQDPSKAFVDAVGVRLRERLGPGIQFAAKTHGSISPMNNDLRFNPDAPRYKDHILMRFWEGPRKKEAPSLYVRLTAASVGFATGAMFPDPGRWREAVDTDGASLAQALKALDQAVDADIVGQDLKRVPKPYDPDHPNGDLLRHKWLQARWSQPLGPSVSTEGFADFCVDELMRAEAIHRWLVAVFST